MVLISLNLFSLVLDSHLKPIETIVISLRVDSPNTAPASCFGLESLYSFLTYTGHTSAGTAWAVISFTFLISGPTGVGYWPIFHSSWQLSLTSAQTTGKLQHSPFLRHLMDWTCSKQSSSGFSSPQVSMDQSSGQHGEHGANTKLSWLPTWQSCTLLQFVCQPWTATWLTSNFRRTTGGSSFTWTFSTFCSTTSACTTTDTSTQSSTGRATQRLLLYSLLPSPVWFTSTGGSLHGPKSSPEDLSCWHNSETCYSHDMQ